MNIAPVTRSLAWLRLTWARFRVARQFTSGRYVLRGSRGQVMAAGPITADLFGISLHPAAVRAGGIVREMELFNKAGELAMTVAAPKGFVLRRKAQFLGKRFQFP